MKVPSPTTDACRAGWSRVGGPGDQPGIKKVEDIPATVWSFRVHWSMTATAARAISLLEAAG